MKLYYSPPSPFSRKARIVAALLGFGPRLELVVADTLDPDDAIRRKNPLGKIPVLETDEGASIYDSAVIVGYLDDLAGGGRVIPRDAGKRHSALTLEALADGVNDAGILQVYETRMRTENERSARWVAHQQDKVSRALAHLEAEPPTQDFAGGGVADVGAIAVACALGYLDLRFEGAWRADHPKLVGWLDAFSKAVPAFAATAA
ncbi:glutathione S-transferase [uncultured Rhodoblastus sp.]|uniref:glutathione S-transferase family protein n=1 Tax=uncultured Rhodoblastus sp. TaxID=543037 RepID=UPI0025EB9F25|nr:glutathione S-transferase [uncultured Rhodoblastus sp.]